MYDQCATGHVYFICMLLIYFLSIPRFRLRGLLVIVGVLMSISFITTAILFAHYDLAVVQLSPAALAEK